MKQGESKPNAQLGYEIQLNYQQINFENENKTFKNEDSESGDNDIIGMMWEPELDFVDDPECINEQRNKIGPMRFMCGVCLGQFRSR